MRRTICIVVALHVVAGAPALAQHAAARVEVTGDTAGAPPGCHAADGVAALDRFFHGMQAVDSLELRKAVAPHFVFTTGKWTPADTFAHIETLPTLVNYARRRAQAREQLALRTVRFGGWRGRQLQFGPVRFTRAAADIGMRPRMAVGRGTYMCGAGIRVLDLGRP